MDDIIPPKQWSEFAHSKALSIALGFLSHYILSNGEWDHSAHIILSCSPIAFGTLAVVEFVTNPQAQTAREAVSIAATTAELYLGALLTSILIYRAFFHRLGKFRGPFAARLSKWYSISRVVPDCQYYNQIEAMHKQYNSDIIRTGPRELSVASADAIPLIHGPMSKCRKTSWYAGSYFLEGSSLQTTRSKADHKERRKVWDHAFSTKALREYEPRLNRHALSLIEKLKEQSVKPCVRVSDWFNYYGFDVMGDIGFSRSFGMLEQGSDVDSFIANLHKGMAPFSFITHIPWAVGVVLRAPFAATDILNFMDWTSKTLRERKQILPEENDIFSRLINPKDDDIPLHLNADSRLLIVAGSDTTSATLTWLAYELCRNLDAQKKLRNIVCEIAPDKMHLNVEDLQTCSYLDGVINETLRLHPAVPSGVQRETPAEGITLVDGRYIPGNIHIWMPMHTIQRDKRYFPSPLEFMPERWTNEAPEYVQDKRAFMPFSTGVYNCVGQKLAMMEMRSVTANLVRTFDMTFVVKGTGEETVKRTRDCFTLNVGPLDVELRPRYK